MGTTMRPERIVPDTHHLIPSDRVEGTPVRRPDGSKLGEIKRLMIDKMSGRVSYAVMGFGGFLGLGEQYHAVLWDALTYDPVQGAYTLDMTEKEVAEAAAEETAADIDWGDRPPPMPLELRRGAYWGV